MSIAAELLRYYDASYPPSILGGGGGAPEYDFPTTIHDPLDPVIPPDVVQNAGVDGTMTFGIKFRPSVNGKITGVSFYKPTTSTQTSHTVEVWTYTGSALLLTHVSSGETLPSPNGQWIDVMLPTAVLCTAGIQYSIVRQVKANEDYIHSTTAQGPNPAVGALEGAANGNVGGFPGGAAVGNYFVGAYFAAELPPTRSAVEENPTPKRRNRGKATAVTPTEPAPEPAPEPEPTEPPPDEAT